MSLYGNYNGKKVTVQFGSIVAEGYAKGTFVKASRNSDAFELEIGGDGNGARTQNADKSGRIEVTLMQGSPTNDAFQAQALIDEISGAGVNEAFVKDINGTAYAHAATAWIVKQADLERAKEQGEVTWIIETHELDVHQGGLTPIPGT